MRKSFKKVMSLVLSAAMAVSLGSGIGTMAPVNTQTAEAATTYYAALGFCTSSSWLFRDRIEGSENADYNKAKEGGKDTTVYHLKEEADVTQSGTVAKAKQITYDYTKHMLKTGQTILNGKTYSAGAYDMVATDATLAYNNAEYSVKIEGLDKMNGEAYPIFQNDPANTGFGMLYVSTNIPRTETGATFSNIQLYFDGKLVHTFTKAYPKADNNDYYQLMLTNVYGSKSKGDSPEKDGDKFEYTMPTSSMEIKFTVSGVATMDTKNADGSVTSGAAVTTQPAVEATQEAVSLKKGKTFTAGNFTYKVTKASNKSGSATVAVNAVKKSAQKKTSLSVPKTVTNKKFKYKVTSINGKAFANCKKLKKVTLGANVKTIKKNAFAKCAKLASINVQGKLTKVEKKAFAGCKKTIKVSGKNKKANVKALKKSGYKKFK